MKIRVLAAASIILTVVLIAAMSHAAPSCCDPKNSSAPTGALVPGQPVRGPIPIAAPQARVATRQIAPASVRATGSNWAGPLPQRQYAASRPVGRPNAPAAPSCCALPNKSAPARGISAAPQAQSRGCACCGGTGGQASYSGFQPVGGQVQFTSNLPSAGQQVLPVAQAPCCSGSGPGYNRGDWNASQPSFPGLW
ncbi:MAG: hypothetical protein ACLP5H_22290 [Desulfomonilaceae bacterium]